VELSAEAALTLAETILAVLKGEEGGYVLNGSKAIMPQNIEIKAPAKTTKNVSLRIPKRAITIFTGVSGSGKSSIAFDTLAAEARRQLNETFSTFVRTFLPRYAQPDADAIENLSMAIVVDQKRMGGGSHSTVGTITDIYTVLRLLYSRIGQPFVGNYNVFSFNDPQACVLNATVWTQNRRGYGCFSGHIQVAKRRGYLVPGLCCQQLGLE
jgi:excinuclease UvrABC ATPase subunit